MKTSEEIDQIAAALCEAQFAFSSLKKDTKGYNYKYATLAQLVEVIKKPLHDNGLCYVQFPAIDEQENDLLITRLIHKSGQYMEASALIVNKDKSDAQKFGSGITYMRRYALSSILGIPSDDDDGREASKPLKAKSPTTGKTKSPTTEIGPDYVFKFGEFAGRPLNDLSSEEHKKLLSEIRKTQGNSKFVKMLENAIKDLNA